MKKFTGKYRASVPSLNLEVDAAVKPSRPCVPGKGKPLGKCNSQLVFLSPKEANKRNTKPGPNVRLCHTRGKEGQLVPVSSPEEASRVASEFCACAQKKNAKSCSVSVKKQRSVFSGYGKAPGRNRYGLAGYGAAITGGEEKPEKNSTDLGDVLGRIPKLGCAVKRPGRKVLVQGPSGFGGKFKKG
jgi:hypothetical protein